MPVPADQRRQFTAQRDRSFRHFAGKPAVTYEPEEDDEDEDEDEEQEHAEEHKSQPPPLKPTSSRPHSLFLTAAELAERRRQAEEKAKREAEEEAEFETESDEGGKEGTGEWGPKNESDEDSSEEESESSSEEEEQRPRKNIVLMSRAQRVALERENGVSNTTKQPKQLTEDEEWELQERRRKERADAIIEEQLVTQRAAREAARKEWDEEDLTVEDDVDDTDPQPGSANYEKELEEALARWKLRELRRIKRDRDALVAREKEYEEIERRRNMTPAERAADDRRKQEAEEEERGSRGKMEYMQKYFHRGAFFNEDLEGAGLAKRNVMGARFQDSADRTLLPQYMQIRDMEKLGKKGHTKYRDMKTEDTGNFGGYLADRGPPRRDEGARKLDSKALDDRDLDERFRPDRDDRRTYGSGGRREDDRGPTGANARPLGERKRFGEDADRRDRDDKRLRFS